MAMEYQIPVIAMAQIRRYEREESTPPTLSMFRDSGSFENDADVALCVWQREEDRVTASATKRPCPTLVKILKQRNGPLGQVDLMLNGKLLRIEQQQEQGELV